MGGRSRRTRRSQTKINERPDRKSTLGLKMKRTIPPPPVRQRSTVPPSSFDRPTDIAPLSAAPEFDATESMSSKEIHFTYIVVAVVVVLFVLLAVVIMDSGGGPVATRFVGMLAQRRISNGGRGGGGVSGRENSGVDLQLASSRAALHRRVPAPQRSAFTGIKRQRASGRIQSPGFFIFPLRASPHLPPDFACLLPT